MSVKALDVSATAATPTVTSRVDSHAAERAVADLSRGGYNASALTASALNKQGAASRITPSELARAAAYLAATA